MTSKKILLAILAAALIAASAIAAKSVKPDGWKWGSHPKVTEPSDHSPFPDGWTWGGDSAPANPDGGIVVSKG